MSADEKGVATFNQFVAENPHTETAEQVVTFSMGIALSTEITLNLVRSAATNMWLKARLPCGYKAFSRRALSFHQSPGPKVLKSIPINRNQKSGRTITTQVQAGL